MVVWRWYDAVVLGSDTESVRLWEPAHGEVAAQRRRPQQQYGPGTRAYLSAGLPGAEWWVAGKAVDQAEDAEVELDEVERAFTPSTRCGTPSPAEQHQHRSYAVSEDSIAARNSSRLGGVAGPAPRTLNRDDSI